MKMDQVSMQIFIRFPIFRAYNSITVCVISSYCNILHDTATKEGYVIKMIVVILKKISHDSIHAKSTMCLKPVFHNEQ